MSQFASVQERTWFVQWVVSDSTVRSPRKRQTQPMIGYWMLRPPRSGIKGRRPHLRGSDLAERRFVVITALLQEGFSVKDSVNEVGAYLGLTTARELELLRTDYYRFAKSNSPYLVTIWLRHFRVWMDWVVRAPNEGIEAARLDLLKRNMEKEAERFVKLTNEIRSSPDAGWYGNAMRNLGMGRIAATYRQTSNSMGGREDIT